MIGNNTHFAIVWPRENLSFSLSISRSEYIGIGDDEIQRQNRITAQIVANYLERRLFPFKRPTQRLPTVDEILPTTAQLLNNQNDQTAESKMKITRQLGTNNAEPTNDDDDLDDISDEEDYANDDNLDPEHLQSVESNHVDSYYPEMNESISNDNEGRWFFFQIIFFSL